MFFTEEDYIKIEKWLSTRTVKDTQFPNADPLNGNELIPIIQDNRNKTMLLHEVVRHIAMLQPAGIFNVTNYAKTGNLTLEQAISLVPIKQRRLGLIITFYNENCNWVIYQFTGTSVNQWPSTNYWKSIIEEAIEEWVFHPDEEDITAVRDGNRTYLKFKDKAYDPDEYSGKGRIILRKNLLGADVCSLDDEDHLNNILTQDMIREDNTIYIIQYDFDLDGKMLSIPEGCTLWFQGGSLKNGSIYLHDTSIIGAYEFSDIGDIKMFGSFKKGQIMTFSDDSYKSKNGAYFVKSTRPSSNPKVDEDEPFYAINPEAYIEKTRQELRWWNGEEWIRVLDITDYNELKSIIEDLINKINLEISDLYNYIKENNSFLLEEINKINIRLNNIDQEIINIKTIIEDINQEIIDIKNNINSIYQLINEINVAISNINQKIDDILNEITNIYNEINNINDEINNINNEIININNIIDIINQTIIDIKTSIENITQEFNEFKQWVINEFNNINEYIDVKIGGLGLLDAEDLSHDFFQVILPDNPPDVEIPVKYTVSWSINPGVESITINGIVHTESGSIEMLKGTEVDWITTFSEGYIAANGYSTGNAILNGDLHINPLAEEDQGEVEPPPAQNYCQTYHISPNLNIVGGDTNKTYTTDRIKRSCTFEATITKYSQPGKYEDGKFVADTVEPTVVDTRTETNSTPWGNWISFSSDGEFCLTESEFRGEIKHDFGSEYPPQYAHHYYWRITNIVCTAVELDCSVYVDGELLQPASKYSTTVDSFEDDGTVYATVTIND